MPTDCSVFRLILVHVPYCRLRFGAEDRSKPLGDLAATR